MPPCKEGDGHFLVLWEREKTHMGCEGEMFTPETNTYWKIEGLKVVRRGMTNHLSGQSPFSSWWHPYEFWKMFWKKARSYAWRWLEASAALLCYYGGYFFSWKWTWEDIYGYLQVLMCGIDCGGGRGLDDKEGGLWELLFAWSVKNEPRQCPSWEQQKDRA